MSWQVEHSSAQSKPPMAIETLLIIFHRKTIIYEAQELLLLYSCSADRLSSGKRSGVLNRQCSVCK